MLMLYGFSLLSNFFNCKSQIPLFQPQSTDHHEYSCAHTNCRLPFKYCREKNYNLSVFWAKWLTTYFCFSSTSKNPLNDLPNMNFGLIIFIFFLPFSPSVLENTFLFQYLCQKWWLFQQLQLILCILGLPAGVSVEYCTVTCG